MARNKEKTLQRYRQEAQRRRQEALDTYNQSPNYCLFCHRKIEIKTGEKLSIVQHKKFCNRSCAISCHNILHPKRAKEPNRFCICGKLKTATAMFCRSCYDTQESLCKFCSATCSRRPVCPRCLNKINKYTRKIKCIEYLGGKCNRCGWSDNYFGFAFHHKVPTEKSFTISPNKQRAWETVRLELDKCELLCSNCHFIEHSKQEVLFYEALKLYNASLL